MLRWKCVKYTDENVLKYLLKLISAKKKKDILSSSPHQFYLSNEHLLKTYSALGTGNTGEEIVLWI